MLTAILILLALSETETHAFVTTGPGPAVYLWSGIGNGKVIYKGLEPSGYFPSEPSGPALSPNKRFVAVIVQDDYLTAKLIEGRPREYLIIVDVEGQVLLSEPDVGAFCWSPIGSQVVYSTRGKGKFLYDPEKNTNQKLEPIRESDYPETHWAGFDNRIYFQSHGRAKAYDPKSGEIAETEYKDVFFSPDGRFYYTGHGDGPSEIWRRSDNTDVTASFFPADRRNNLVIITWLDSNHLLAREDGYTTDQTIILNLTDSSIRLLPVTTTSPARRVRGYVRETKEIVLVKEELWNEKTLGLVTVPVDSFPVRTEEQAAMLAPPRNN